MSLDNILECGNLFDGWQVARLWTHGRIASQAHRPTSFQRPAWAAEKPHPTATLATECTNRKPRRPKRHRGMHRTTTNPQTTHGHEKPAWYSQYHPEIRPARRHRQLEHRYFEIRHRQQDRRRPPRHSAQQLRLTTAAEGNLI